MRVAPFPACWIRSRQLSTTSYRLTRSASSGGEASRSRCTCGATDTLRTSPTPPTFHGDGRARRASLAWEHPSAADVIEPRPTLDVADVRAWMGSSWAPPAGVLLPTAIEVATAKCVLTSGFGPRYADSHARPLIVVGVLLLCAIDDGCSGRRHPAHSAARGGARLRKRQEGDRRRCERHLARRGRHALRAR
jgi:hypothetical protein